MPRPPVARASSPAVRVRLRHRLAQRQCDAAVTDRPGTVPLIAELALGDGLVAIGAPEGSGLFGSPRPCRRHDLAAGSWISWATRAASSRVISPTSLPSDVVMGALGRSCSAMYLASSSTRTKGRNVLGPGRRA